jgi:hypothetical protein
MDLREDRVDLLVFRSCLWVEREGLSFERPDLLLDPQVQSLDFEDLWFERKVQRLELKDLREDQKVHWVFLQVHSVFLQDLWVFLQDLWVFLPSLLLFLRVQRFETTVLLVCHPVHSYDSPPHSGTWKGHSVRREARSILLRVGSARTAVREDRWAFEPSRRRSRGVLLHGLGELRGQLFRCRLQ